VRDSGGACYPQINKAQHTAPYFLSHDRAMELAGAD